MTPIAQQVHAALYEKGIETPMLFGGTPKSDRISGLFKQIMQELYLDLTDDSLKGTPDRIAKMFIKEIFAGLDYTNFPKITTVENKFNYDQMICVDSINLNSVCEHHFVTIDGLATVAYIPDKKVLGLSKINRLVKFFSQRPQIQERLTEQICAAMQVICETEDVAVLIKATHFCVKQRGVQDQSSFTVTSKLAGKFINKPECRNEFLSLAHQK